MEGIHGCYPERRNSDQAAEKLISKPSTTTPERKEKGKARTKNRSAHQISERTERAKKHRAQQNHSIAICEGSIQQ